jgi:hypothetical protein
MQAGDMILQLLFAANKDPSEAIELAMGSLDDPASGLFSSAAFGVFGFITPRLDTRDAPVNRFEHLSDAFGIIAFVQRDVFVPAIVACRRALPGIVYRLFQQADVVHTGTSDSQSQRDPIGIRHQGAFLSLLGTVRGIFSRLLAAQSCLGHRTVHALSTQVQSNRVIIISQRLLPKQVEDTCL